MIKTYYTNSFIGFQNKMLSNCLYVNDIPVADIVKSTLSNPQQRRLRNTLSKTLRLHKFRYLMFVHKEKPEKDIFGDILSGNSNEISEGIAKMI